MADVDPTQLISTGINAVTGQANANTSDTTSGVTQQAPTIAGKELGETVQALTPSEQEAEQGIQGAAETEEELGVPAADTAYGQVQTIAPNTEEVRQNIIDNSYRLANTMRDIQASTDRQAEIAASNPTQEVMQRFFGDHPVMSSIAMILGGIGSGLTGQPNAAEAMLDRAIKGAQKTKSDQIYAEMQKQKQLQGIGDNLISDSTMQAMANQMGAHAVLSGVKTGLDTMTYKIGSKTAVDRGQILKFTNLQRLFANDLDAANGFKTSGVQNNTDHTNATVQVLGGGAKAMYERPEGVKQDIQQNRQRHGFTKPHKVKPSSASNINTSVDYPANTSSNPKPALTPFLNAASTSSDTQGTD